MAKARNHVPDGYHSITPYLIVNGAAKAIDYYTAVFGAKERMRMPNERGGVGHAELEFGDSVVMLADESPDVGARSPARIGDSAVGICVYVPDVDAVVEKAVAGGAKIDREIADQFYGDRSGSIIDPFGHRWYVMTHIEDISEDEMQRRAAEAVVP